MTGPLNEPITVINLIAMPADAADGFLQGWTATIAPLRDVTGQVFVRVSA